MEISLDTSLWGLIRLGTGTVLVSVSVLYALAGTTIFGWVPVNQVVVHLVVAVLGLRGILLAVRGDDETNADEPDDDGTAEYGYDDQWERENL